ncbi:MAG: hypothetical protein ACTHOJ_07870 [Sphingomonas oligoaromativorans]
MKLDARLEDLRAERDALAEARSTLVVRSTDADDPDLLLEIERHGQEMARIDLLIGGIEDTRGRLAGVGATVAKEAADSEAVSARKRAAASAKAVRAALIALDEAVDALAGQHRAVREAISKFFQDADGATRQTEEFKGIRDLVSGLPAIMLMRLAHNASDIHIPHITGMVDRESPVPSTRDRFEPILTPLSPPPGRPSSKGDEPQKDAS